LDAGERAQRKCMKNATDGKERWEAQTFLFFLYWRGRRAGLIPVLLNGMLDQ